MTATTANGIRIEYETFGERGQSPLLLVMGLGAQLIAWDEAFCRDLAARGFHVIRFDNRDAGKSQWFDELGVPDIGAAMAAAQAGTPFEAPYSLRDMAADAFGLLSALDIDRAHIAGASMGGMIVQQMAIDHPERVISLTSIMSMTGEPGLPPPAPEAMAALMRPVATDRASAIEAAVAGSHVIGSTGFPFDESRARFVAETSYDRGYHPQGVQRQLVAIQSSGSRREALGALAVPALVIHGSADPLVPVAGGKATATAIPGAELLIIDGMGHDLPAAVQPQVIDAIAALATKADAR